jgi:hypothetical protein
MGNELQAKMALIAILIIGVTVMYLVDKLRNKKFGYNKP